MDLSSLQTDFSVRLAALRRQKGLSQEQLAERIGVSRQAVSKWESAQCLPETETLAALCIALDCSADTLLFGTAAAVKTEPTASRLAMPLSLALCSMGAVLFLALLWVRQDARCWIFGCAFQIAGLACRYALRGTDGTDEHRFWRLGSFVLSVMPAAGVHLLFARPFILHVFRNHSAALQVSLFTGTPIVIYAAFTALLYFAPARLNRVK